MEISNNNIDTTIREITVQETLRLDMDRVREDLMGLYSDIVIELSKRAPGQEVKIYEYEELMAREQQIYIPEQAYEAGVAARGREYNPAFMEYSRNIILDPNNQAFLSKRDALYRELRGILGEVGGILDEFNELYRDCHGIIGQKINVFFDMGFYNAVDPAKESQ